MVLASRNLGWRWLKRYNPDGEDLPHQPRAVIRQEREPVNLSSMRILVLSLKGGDEMSDGIAAFTTSFFGSVIEIHALGHREEAFGSSDAADWVIVAACEVFEVVLLGACQRTERVLVGAWHDERLYPQQVTH